MADIDRKDYAYDRLKEAMSAYDGMAPAVKRDNADLAAMIAIGHYLKLVVDGTVKFRSDGNVSEPR